MNDIGTKLAKVALLAGGAALGALLARWFDDWLASYSEEQSEYDKTRYAQGLTPIALRPQGPPQTTFEITIEEEQNQEYREEV